MCFLVRPNFSVLVIFSSCLGSARRFGAGVHCALLPCCFSFILVDLQELETLCKPSTENFIRLSIRHVNNGGG